MKISDKLSEVYGDYYRDQSVLKKRAISGRQTLSHLQAMLPMPHYHSILDIGAGDGSVLAEMDRIGISDELHAVEISVSGCESIRQKSLPSLCSVKQFDGYTIPATDKCYQLGLAIHVLEHVEHERLFLQEIARVCEAVYIEVPLELTLTVNRSIKSASPYGHINFYSPATFRNLLVTTGLDVLDFRIFPNSLEYELLMGGRFKGRIKSALRNALLSVAPEKAPLAMTYMAGAICRAS